MLRSKKRPSPSVGASEYLTASQKGILDIVQRYLAENEDNSEAVNVRDEEGDTAATLAALHNHAEIVVELLAAGCKVDRRTQLIEDAKSDGDEETARILNAYQIRMNFIKKLTDEQHLKLGKQSIREILALSDKRYLMLADKVAFLMMYAMLSEETFSVELAKALIKFPRVQKIKVDEIKNLHPHKTEYKLSPQRSFFTDKRPVEYAGGQAIVNAAYKDKDDLKPSYGVKWFRRHNKKNTNYPDKELSRETKYNLHFTQREESFYFEINDRMGMCFPWQHGDQLERCTERELSGRTPETRVKCLKTLLEELNLLHGHERCHNDLNLLNVIVNFQDETLRLIDFGKAKKVSRLFDDDQNYSKDIYDLCKIVRKLFPELKKKTKSLHIEAMKYLDQALFHRNSQYVCTTAQALAYCVEVIKLPKCGYKDDNWNDAVLALKAVADKTINSPVLTTENLRRGSVRAATFHYKL